MKIIMVENGSPQKWVRESLPLVILLIILGVGAYLRFIGLNWDESSHPHPDERFLTMVETALQIPDSLGEYFNTQESPLNPHNVGYTFFVYGTFPIFIVRFIGEWVEATGYDQIHLVGRAAAASFDLLSIILVYLIGSRLYKKRVGLLGAAFAAFSVLLIQHSHFFVVDIFANTFILLGIYFAVRILDHGKLIDYALFGVALGMSVASKISAAPLAIIIVIAAFIHLINKEDSLEECQDASLLPISSDRKTLWKKTTDYLNRLNRSDGKAWRGLSLAVGGLVLAAFLSLLTFRVLQPYAFDGPSFFGIGLNDSWLSNMAEIRRQQAGDADFPPALQWAMRTPVIFALKNMVLWGMGAPLGILSWAAFVWALVRFFRKDELKHSILLIWIGIIFLWQSTQFTPAMRYQLPVYPTLSIMAAWGLWKAWDLISNVDYKLWRRIGRGLVGSIGVFVLVSTGLWAFAFVNIYQETMTQVAASRWIYKNIPGAINFVLQEEDAEYFEPGILPSTIVFLSEASPSLELSYKSESEGALQSILLTCVEGIEFSDVRISIQATILEVGPTVAPIASADFEGILSSREIEISFGPYQNVELIYGKEYLIQLEFLDGEGLGLRENVRVKIDRGGNEVIESLPLPEKFTIFAGTPSLFNLRSQITGQAHAFFIPYASLLGSDGMDLVLEMDIYDISDLEHPLVSSTYRHEAMSQEEFGIRIPFEQPIQLEEGNTYVVEVDLLEGKALSLRRSILIHETTWDLALPMRIDNKDGFGGLYQSVNQEMYWRDNEDDNYNTVPDKLERIVDTLTEGDYLIIATNRQYGTIARVPTRYPLSTAYYRALLGCQVTQSVSSCASMAQPGQIQGELGYELKAVFQSNPTLGPIEINDQAAEEAFTVYDHPKVLIFKKDEDYSGSLVEDLLSRIDVSHVDNSPPGELTNIPSNITLPDDRLGEQRSGGTWSEYFNRDSLINRFSFLTVPLWWIAIGLLGVIAFPLTRVAFRGLHDGGYALARIVGLLFLAWLTWILASFEVPFERPLILGVLLFLMIISGLIAWRDREELKSFIQEKKKEILWVEVLALAFFLLDLGIRLGNPDLWHPYKGGEKPMNFSYLNAVLKSTSFPPYDPWFAGGYINYYYFGYVIVGVPIKFLGIVPSIAYNLVVPTLFSLLGLSAFTIGYNLLYRLRSLRNRRWKMDPRLVGVIAAVALVILGNLGSARLIYEGFRDIGGWPGEEQAPLASGIVYATKGVVQYLTGDQAFPVRTDQWYWDASRAIEPSPGEAGPITEFPFFTFLYADLHAHMIDLPITVAVLAWCLSWILLSKDKKSIGWLDGSMALFIGAIFLGAMRPTNTWDFPTYWGLAIFAVLAAVVYRRGGGHWRAMIEALIMIASFGLFGVDWYLRRELDIGFAIEVCIALIITIFIVVTWIRRRGIYWKVFLESASIAIFLMALSYLLYQPFNSWYKQGYTAVNLWNGSQTQLNDYIIVHGFFLFLILSWMLWELWQWMARTHISALHRVRQYLIRFTLLLLGCTVLLFGLNELGIETTWLSVAKLMFTSGMQSGFLSIPVLFLAVILLFWAGLPIEKRIVLFLVVIGILLTILVEVIVLEGDISRMNTVFKFYLQVWTLFSLSAVAGFAWVWQDFSQWSKGLRSGWIAIAIGLTSLAALFPITATPAKISDRMAEEAPHSLDAMAYMPYSTYHDIEGPMALAEDYEAIQWMQENIEGSPVIVEANTPEYRWGSRYTIYTGLPGVLGWNWHQRQQRGFLGDNSVMDRATEIASFYSSPSVEDAIDFIHEYDVRYIVVGQLEKQYYEKLDGCVPIPDGGGVTCDMAGRPVGMPQPEVDISECQPMSEDPDPEVYSCPTQGLAKFEELHDIGFLEEAFRVGETVIYKVVE